MEYYIEFEDELEMGETGKDVTIPDKYIASEITPDSLVFILDYFMTYRKKDFQSILADICEVPRTTPMSELVELLSNSLKSKLQ